MKLQFKLLLVTVFVLLFCSFITLPDNFTKLLNRAGMTFEAPEGWVETPVINNNQMHYNYAIKYPGKDFEVRYTVRPMDTLLMQYQKMVQQRGTVMIHPNKYFGTALMATMINISSGEKAPQTRTYDSVAVKKEFNADRGMFALTYTKKDFGQDYRFCNVIALQKDNVAYAYCFIMFNNQDDFKALAPVVYHALKFK
ncbi:MAG: hypothetical protein ABIN91_05355 [Mucilaginibacter sp.]|uniref:hypothetical protein n=1 Tax=Mucilaginibacter sp. TaxID=1882438 RepID=UPI0032647219